MGRLNLSEIQEYWKHSGDTKKHKPPVGGEFPEGFDVLATLRKMVGERVLLEIGCGEGRLCKAFDKDKYLGVDISHQAVEIAEQNNPDYNFDVVSYFDTYPASDTVLLYTLLLHVSDDDVEAFVKGVADSTEEIIVAEILGREWRREGSPPVFNRDLNDYIDLFDMLGWEITEHQMSLYQRYKDFKVNGKEVDWNKDISFMRFRPCR